MTDSNLWFSAIPLPAGAGRGVVETLRWPDGLVVAGAGGQAVDLTAPGGALLRLVYGTSDATALPAGGAVVPGTATSVAVLAEWAVPLSEGESAVTLPRDPLAGSVWAVDAAGAGLAVAVTGRSVSVAPSTGPGWVRFRPLLPCVVVGFLARLDEWAAVTGWEMTLQEVVP